MVDWGTISNFVLNGTISGIPVAGFSLFSFILGLVIGYLLRRLIKLALLVGFIVILASYLGFINVSEVKNMAQKYGPDIISYLALIIGIIPVSLGLVIGLVIGFFYG
ncbi:MAG: hypothetical protein ACP5GU_02110 [Thermoprotei archaeon]|jgi:uncharacterized membrane protein (Fun14 family)